HQANERILDHCIKKLAAPPEKFYKNLARTGNTSAASIPLALNELFESGNLHPGQTLLCVGFGGGLTWAGALLRVKPAKEGAK
ncbi:MAG: 3-oxoacyl-[acyl-carrier-protein] synthase III C-terminal domain-containing protein, partial [Gemmiger sp.]|nr:3-oxoacyl-[acyl-carrier-protein] synthase III C-terminal domain-containing protein [Gemmiger sp.]